MKKFGKLVCGIAVIAALLSADIKWPAIMASAEETNSKRTEGQEKPSAAGQRDENSEQAAGSAFVQAEGTEAEENSMDGDAAEGNMEGTGSESAETGTDAGEGGNMEGTGTAENGTDAAEGGNKEGTGSESAENGTGAAGGSGSMEGNGAASEENGMDEDNGPADEGAAERDETGQTEGEGESSDAEGASEEPGRAWKRTSGAMDEETAGWVEEAGESLAGLAAQQDIMALVYLSDEYTVRSLPSSESDTVVNVLSGQMVNILDLYINDETEIWYYVNLEYKGVQMYGYVESAYLACSDARFLEWQTQYGMDFSAAAYTVDGAERAAYPDIEQFPESYRPALQALKEKHPNWTFVKMNTTLDWEFSISSELMNDRSLVYKTLPDWAKNGLYDKGTWYYASEAAVKVYMDPRNSLTESAVFQFEQLTYNEAYHTLEAVDSFLGNTFMNSNAPAPGSDKTYAQLFWEIGREDGRKVSPFHLAARVLQEQGAGTSPLISGKYPGYEGYYNYFNVGASGNTNQQVIESGLKYAKDHGWSTVEAALRGGADFISANYIKKGQDTLYLQKFNVNPNGAYAPFTHQYMQNISAPTSEASSIRRLYEGAGALDSTFVFKIPVYENMPAAPCGPPNASTEITLPLPEGYGDPVMWLDGVAYPAEVRNGSLVVTAPNGNAKTAVLYKYNENGVPVGMSVWGSSYNGVVYTAIPISGLEDLLTYHGFSIRITGKSGIRFKTGISTELRGRLLADGVDGYRLKEYGTLVTNNANLGQYPMIKGGTKIAGGVSYGMDGNGNMQDVVFETVDGRYRFTSVLVGLPVEQYKTEFAFRGYAVLEKNGIQTIIYGPVVARSIYALSHQLINQGTYEAGSEADTFLRKLIHDADALPAQTEGP